MPDCFDYPDHCTRCGAFINDELSLAERDMDDPTLCEECADDVFISEPDDE